MSSEDAFTVQTGADGSVTFSVHVAPRAKREGVVGLHGSSLKIALRAPPVDGEANDALIRFLAKALGVPRSQVQIVSGATSREKRIRVEGVSIVDIRVRLLPE